MCSFTRALLNVAFAVSLGLAYAFSGSFVVAWVHSVVPRRRRVHSVSIGFTRAHLEVFGFIRGRAWVHSRALSGRQVYSGSRGFTWAYLGGDGFIRIRVCLHVRA